MDFLIEKEDLLERILKRKNSGVDQAFTPSCPISPLLFCGRVKESESIVDGLTKPGGHVILYGDRGVGKTSLANYVDSQMIRLYCDTKKISCSSSDKFSSVAERILMEYNISYDEITTTKKESGFSGLFTGRMGKEIQKKQNNSIDNPTWLGSKIKNKEGILIIDEFDTIPENKEKAKFSQLIKYLSDNNSNLHILLVGISRNVSELLGGHLSADRSLTPVLLQRMSEDELTTIIKKGEERTGIHFQPNVTHRIVKLSHGMPYFTHSLALESSKIAVYEDRKEVTMEDFKQGLHDAIDNIEVSLKEKYNRAIGVHGTLNMKKIIYAAAAAGCKGVFTSKEWVENYALLFENKSQQAIYGSMAKNIGDEPDKFISRIDTGKFVFSDSRMPCYILLLGNPENPNYPTNITGKDLINYSKDKLEKLIRPGVIIKYRSNDKPIVLTGKETVVQPKEGDYLKDKTGSYYRAEKNEQVRIKLLDDSFLEIRSIIEIILK